MLAAGIVLIAVGVGFALASLIRYRRLRWVAYVGSAGLTVVNGSRRRAVPWAEIGTVRLVDSRLEIRSLDGRRTSHPRGGSNPFGSIAAAEIVRAIEPSCLPAHDRVQRRPSLHRLEVDGLFGKQPQDWRTTSFPSNDM